MNGERIQHFHYTQKNRNEIRIPQEELDQLASLPVGRVDVRSGTKIWHGTACVISFEGKFVILTAQHVINPLFEKQLSLPEDSKNYNSLRMPPRDIQIQFGNNKPLSVARTLYFPVSKDVNPNLVDVALCLLSNQHIPDELKNQAIHLPSREEYENLAADSPFAHAVGHLGGEALTAVSLQVDSGVKDNLDKPRLNHDISGMSGGPIVVFVEGEPIIISVVTEVLKYYKHHNGIREFSHSVPNSINIYALMDNLNDLLPYSE